MSANRVLPSAGYVPYGYGLCKAEISKFETEIQVTQDNNQKKPKTEREKRLAQALRDNLKRRKAQMRERKSGQGDDADK